MKPWRGIDLLLRDAVIIFAGALVLAHLIAWALVNYAFDRLWPQ